MLTKTPPRRIKARLNLFFLMVGIFFATLLVCGLVSSPFLFSKTHLLSPLSAFSRGNLPTDTRIAQIKQFCDSLHIACTSITMPDTATVQITTDTNAIVLLSTKKDIAQQLSSLQRIAAQLTIKGKQFKKLDFRFDNIQVSF